MDLSGVFGFIGHNALNIGLACGGTAIIAFIAAKLVPSLAEKISASINSMKGTILKYFVRKLGDDLFAEILVTNVMFAVEKTFKTSAGKEKFDIVKKRILDACPNWADKYVEDLIERVYQKVIVDSKLQQLG